MIHSKPELVAIAIDTAIREGIPPEFCCAIIEILSGWNPALVEQSMDPMQYNPNLSSLKAPNARLGLLQINSQAAKDIGYKQTQMELLEPTLNVQIGCKMLKKALETTQNNADRALLCVYGYSVAGLIPKIQAKVGPYKEFIPTRPK
jgi:soluble lytic murein transglycosylase-like protein